MWRVHMFYQYISLIAARKQKPDEIITNAKRRHRRANTTARIVSRLFWLLCARAFSAGFAWLNKRLGPLRLKINKLVKCVYDSRERDATVNIRRNKRMYALCVSCVCICLSYAHITAVDRTRLTVAVRVSYS